MLLYQQKKKKKEKKNNNNFVRLNCAFETQNKEEITLSMVEIVTREETETMMNGASPYFKIR